MPIEIRELIVRAAIAEDVAQGQTLAMPPASEMANMNENMKQLIVDEAVQQVLLILERQKDR